jgi:hypothetical protein
MLGVDRCVLATVWFREVSGCMPSARRLRSNYTWRSCTTFIELAERAHGFNLGVNSE